MDMAKVAPKEVKFSSHVFIVTILSNNDQL